MRLFWVAAAAAAVACGGGKEEGEGGPLDYREEMRAFVRLISEAAREKHPGFLVIPQNGQELLTLAGDADGPVAAEYVAAISGVGREDLFYGYEEDDVATPPEVTAYFLGYLDHAEEHSLEVLAIDYCSTPEKMDDSYQRNAEHDFISFAADHRDLDNVPGYPAEPFGVSSDDVLALADAENFLYLVNPAQFGSKDEMLAAIAETDYDLVVMDLFFNDAALTADDLAAIREKGGGGMRLLVAYMSIGEAETYRWYWQPEWKDEPPEWLENENPDWPGNYKVRYWMPGWQEVIAGGGESYLARILAAGFDGVYLDIIDAFEYFEAQEN
jgi:cysteinyl-tRNA synthetase